VGLVADDLRGIPLVYDPEQTHAVKAGNVRLLPQTNFKQCGEPTCYTFALKLSASQKTLADCSPLVEPQYTEKRSGLEAVIIEAPSIG